MKILKLIRVHQWVKNVFVFAPLFFGGVLDDWDKMPQAILAFLGFCLIASTIYILNDYFDIEADKQHPIKKDRPLASGDVSTKTALFMGVIFLLISIGGMLLLNNLKIVCIYAFYFLMNILYTLKLKHIAILDITIIAIGFVLRIICGGIAGNVELSNWIILMTFLLALYIGLAKRRDDVLIFENTGKVMRKSIHGYNLTFVNQAMAIMSSVIIVSYLMYINSHAERLGDYIFISSLFVILGLLRYLQIALVEGNSGSPSKIVLKDLPIQVCIALWVINYIICIYVI